MPAPAEGLASKQVPQRRGKRNNKELMPCIALFFRPGMSKTYGAQGNENVEIKSP